MGRSMGEGISHLATKTYTETYTGLVKKVFSIGDHNALQDELNNNPVLQLALSVITGEVYCDEGKRKKLKTLSLVLLDSNI